MDLPFEYCRKNWLKILLSEVQYVHMNLARAWGKFSTLTFTFNSLHSAHGMFELNSTHTTSFPADPPSWCTIGGLFRVFSA